MTSHPIRSLFRRPVLAPGLRVLTRGPGELQIGLSGRHSLRVPDSASVRRILSVLARGETPRDAPATRRVLASLAPVLREGEALVHPQIPPEEVAATMLRHPHDAPERLGRRGRQRIRVVGDLPLGFDPRTLLRHCGLGVVEEDDARPPTAVLVIAHGEPDRADLDRWLRDGVPHLLLRVIESEIVLGPFVAPGRTACLRCLDAHHDDADDHHSGLLADYLRSERHDGVADPVDSALATVALGWAVSDLVRYAEHDRPTTWSATLELAPGQTSADAVLWLPHPGCGCSWGAREDSADSNRRSVTLGA